MKNTFKKYSEEKPAFRSDLETLLESMGESFEDSNFEDANFAGIAQLSGMSNSDVQTLQKAAKIKNQMIQNNPALDIRALQQRNGIVKHLGGGDNSAAISAIIANSKGDLNLTVTRGSANINSPLPFVLFGSNDFDAGYISTLASFMSNLPAGTTVAVSVSSTGNVVFTYTNGANVDVITVSNLGNINYRSFLSSMDNNYFATKYFLASISDETYNLVQYAQPLFFGLLSALGMTKANQLVFRSRTNSWQYRKDRVEVVLPEQTITPDFSFAMSIVAVANFSMGFDFFMSQRVNMNKVV